MISRSIASSDLFADTIRFLFLAKAVLGGYSTLIYSIGCQMSTLYRLTILSARLGGSFKMFSVTLISPCIVKYDRS